MNSDPKHLAKEIDQLKNELAQSTRTLQLLQLLANATNVLISDELDYETRLRHLSDIIVPYFADWCAIDIVRGPHPSYKIVTHSSPEKRKIAEEMEAKYVPKNDYRYGVAEVMRTQQATLYTDMPDELVRNTTVNEEHYKLIRALGIVSVMVVPLISRGSTIGAITFVAADSGHHYSESDLEMAKQLAHRAAVALDNAMLHEDVLEANRAKEKFLAMLAHELRNPLTPIRNSLPILLAKGQDDYELEDIARLMERQIGVMSRLLDDLFDVARITEGKIQFHMENMELISALEHAVASLRPEFERKGFYLAVYMDEAPLYIRGDRVRIEQVIVNLLNNAAKYTPAGGHITLECTREDDRAVICVRDTGKGIPPEMLHKIFQLFIQVDQSIDRSEGGLGLGLTLVKMIVEHHGGSVEARSEGLNAGSEFIVTLPLVPRIESKEERVSRPILHDSPKRILVVDDNEDAANSIGKLMGRLGHDVRIAYNGFSALEIAKEFSPQVVLLDIGLPGIDGYETARRMRIDLPDKQVLLIALSGYGQEDDRRRTKEAGFDFHLIKPFDTQELRDIINAWPKNKEEAKRMPNATSP